MKSKYLYLFSAIVLVAITSKSQVLFKMGDYRNLTYSSVGYNGSFGNVTFGIARRDYIRLIKKEIIGVLDISIPITHQSFTRRVIKKGLQIDLYKNKTFKIPFTFASSSIVRQNNFFKYHDITSEFTINPGIYNEKFTLAFDLKYELILFRYIKYSQQYRQGIDSKAVNHWTQPLFDVFKLGVIGGLNFKRWVVYMKTGYERNPFSFKKYIPGYIVFGFGFKFGTKPMKNI
ncbi:MAG TPA: hypothetical protein VN026_17000 [Bacteroidia bacterium]|nr:hypothetical protein [Bacteroidia bacterium]